MHHYDSERWEDIYDIHYEYLINTNILSVIEALLKAKKEIIAPVITHQDLDADLHALESSYKEVFAKHGLTVTQVRGHLGDEGYAIHTVLKHHPSKEFVELKRYYDPTDEQVDEIIKYLSTESVITLTQLDIINPTFEHLIPLDIKMRNALQMSHRLIRQYQDCPRCFFFLQKKITKESPFDNDQFSLGNAVDSKLKADFDVYRNKQKSHPLMEKIGIRTVPYNNSNLSKWRNIKESGLRYYHEESKFLLTGTIDDLWINDRGELVVVDYKMSAKDNPIVDNNQTYQLSLYAFILKQYGFKVSPMGYIIFAKPNLIKKNITEDEAFAEMYTNNELPEAGSYEPNLFLETTIKECPLNEEAITDVLSKIRKSMEDKQIPLPTKNLYGDYCRACYNYNAIKKFEQRLQASQNKE